MSADSANTESIINANTEHVALSGESEIKESNVKANPLLLSGESGHTESDINTYTESVLLGADAGVDVDESDTLAGSSVPARSTLPDLVEEATSEVSISDKLTPTINIADIFTNLPAEDKKE